jgi:hypothetical protein
VLTLADHTGCPQYNNAIDTSRSKFRVLPGKGRSQRDRRIHLANTRDEMSNIFKGGGFISVRKHQQGRVVGH